MADIRYVVTADTKGAEANIKKLDGAVKEAADTAEKKAKPSFAGMWKQVAAGALIADAVKKSLSALTGFMKDSVAAAAAQELAEKNLADALSVTGRNVDALMPKFKDFANAVQQQTVYTDDAVLSSMSLMAQLTDLDQVGLERATQGAIGMASVFKTDLQSAATLVAKALAGNVGALSRYGIQVDQNLTMEQKRVEILRQLSLMYERAKGETDTFSGALTQLKNMWDEVQETVGNAIVKNESLRDGIKSLTEWVTKLSQSEDFKLWLSIIIDGLMKAAELAGKLAKALLAVGDALAGLKGKNKEVEDSQIKLNEALERARAAGHDLGNKIIPVLKEELEKTTPVIRRATEAIDKSSRAIIDTAIPAARAWVSELGNIGETIEHTTIPAARDMSELWQGMANEDLPNITEAARATTRDTDTAFNTMFGNIAGALGGWAEKILNTFKSIFDAVKKASGETSIQVQQAADNMGKSMEGAATGTSTAWLGAIGMIVGAFTGFMGLLDFLDSKIHKLTADMRKEYDEAYEDFVKKKYGQEGVDFIFAPRDKRTAEGADVIAAQHGFSGIVKRPTMFLAGERGAERVTVTPNINVNPSFGNSKTTINIDGRVVAMAIAPYIPELSRMGAMKFHKNGLVEH